MSFTVDLLFKAHLEIFEGWKWFEEQEAGLGYRFEDEVFRKIQLIEANPFQYPLKKKAREALTDTFPYLIVYRINKRRKVIMIISIFHTSRHPKKKY